MILVYNCSFHNYKHTSHKCCDHDEGLCLFIPDPSARIITGYHRGVIFKKRTYYTVINGEGQPAPKILITDTLLMPIGTYMELKPQYH
jgi:hypothetical protein